MIFNLWISFILGFNTALGIYCAIRVRQMETSYKGYIAILEHSNREMRELIAKDGEVKV